MNCYVYCKNCDETISIDEAMDHYPIICSICDESTCNMICDLFLCQQCESCIDHICRKCFYDIGELCIECYESNTDDETNDDETNS